MKRRREWPSIAAVLIIFALIVLAAWLAGRKDDGQYVRRAELQHYMARADLCGLFVEQHLPQVMVYTQNELTARRILLAVHEASQDQRLDPELILAVIHVESHFSPRARSKVGAQGLMQVMPVTAGYVATRLGIWLDDDDDLYDIEKNIKIGCVFLADCIRRLGERGGLGYYYAGRHTAHYDFYCGRVAAARQAWQAEGGIE